MVRSVDKTSSLWTVATEISDMCHQKKTALNINGAFIVGSGSLATNLFNDVFKGDIEFSI
jgi:hypothetical protein